MKRPKRLGAIWVPVPWSEWPVLVKETRNGLPVLRWGQAPADKLATRRQLRTAGLRPGGQEPVAYLRFRYRNQFGQVEKCVYARLFLVTAAKPVRPMTLARWLAVDSALAARRVCRRCRGEQSYCVPTSTGLCHRCDEATGASEAIAAERRWSA